MELDLDDPDSVLRLIIEIVRLQMLQDIAAGRDGPREITHEQLYQLIRQGRVIIRFRMGNPPTPEFAFLPVDIL